MFSLLFRGIVGSTLAFAFIMTLMQVPVVFAQNNGNNPGNGQFTFAPPPPDPPPSPGAGGGASTPGAGGGGSSGSSFGNPLAAGNLYEFLNIALDALILILFPFVVLFFVYGAFNLVRAQGNAQMIASGKKALLWTTVGALIILGARAITIAIQNTVGEIRNATVEAPHPHRAESDTGEHV